MLETTKENQKVNYEHNYEFILYTSKTSYTAQSDGDAMAVSISQTASIILSTKSSIRE